MTQETFDPYRKWLGIPPEEQPANYYRLLGLAVFEKDPDAISNAADRQMAHIRTFQNGRYGVVSQRLLNELSTARICLLDRTKKASYDQMLRSLGWRAAGEAVATSQAASLSQYPAYLPQSLPVPQQSLPGNYQSSSDDPLGLATGPSAPTPRRLPVKKKSSNGQLIFILIGLALVVILGVVVVVVNNSNPPEPTKTPLATTTTTPPATAKKPTEKEQEKVSDKDKEKDKAVNKDSNKEKTPAVEGSSKTSEATKSPDSGKKNPDKSTKGGESSTPKRPDPGGTTAASKLPRIPKHVEGEVPDFGSLPVLSSNDSALELATLTTPPEGEVKAALAELRPQWKEALLKAQARADKVAFARQLLLESGGSRNSPARQFGLLKAAYDLAIECADDETFIKATDFMASGFAIDPWECKARAFLFAAAANSEPEDLLALIPACEKLVTSAIAADKMIAAAKFARAGSALATKGQDLALAKKFDQMLPQLDATSKEREAAEKAQDKLVEDRNNPQANLTYGSYLCFVKGDWNKGLKYLRRGSDQDLKQAAELDLANPFAPAKQAELGEAWFTAAKNFEGFKKSEILRRAKSWYERAVGSLTEGDKTEVEQKLKEINTQLSAK